MHGQKFPIIVYRAFYLRMVAGFGARTEYMMACTLFWLMWKYGDQSTNYFYMGNVPVNAWHVAYC